MLGGIFSLVVIYPKREVTHENTEGVEWNTGEEDHWLQQGSRRNVKKNKGHEREERYEATRIRSKSNHRRNVEWERKRARTNMRSIMSRSGMDRKGKDMLRESDG